MCYNKVYDPVRSHPLEHESATVTLGRPASNGIESGAVGSEGDDDE